jgi:hypothetical protein
MKKFLLWFLAVIITLAAVKFQRSTGPTKPIDEQFSFNGQRFETSLPRSWETNINNSEASGDYESLNKRLKINIDIENLPDDIEGMLVYRLYPGNGPSDTLKALREGSAFTVSMPSQPPAGKISYNFILKNQSVSDSEQSEEIKLGGVDGVILRFKSHVPAGVLIPHILLMFIAMFVSNYIGIAAFSKTINLNSSVIVLLFVFGTGGLILGPLVQNYAFGAYWTGWPFGSDLTDNKTLLAFIIWVAAWMLNRKKSRRYMYIIAAVVMLLVYSIPHSTAGSEYDRSKGQIVTGR